MRIALVANHGEGHQLVLHARALIPEFHRRGWHVVMVAPRNVFDHPTYLALREELGDQFSTAPMDVQKKTWPLPVLRYTMQNALNDGAWATSIGQAISGLPEPVDIVFCLNLDLIQVSASRRSPFGPTPFGGILMGNTWYQPSAGIKGVVDRWQSLLKRSFRRLLRQPSCVLVTTADPVLARECQALPGGSKVHYYPERGQLGPLPSKSDARTRLGLPQGAFVVFSYGWQTGRKGVQELISTLQHPSWPVGTVVAIMGSQRHDAKAILESAAAHELVSQGKLFLYPGVADDDTEAAGFAAADAIWIGYPGFMTTSGVMVQAAVAGKPILAGDHGVIGHLVRNKDLGLTFPIDDISAICQAVSQLAGDTTRYNECQQNCKEMGANHRPGEFERVIADQIEGAMKK